MSIYGLFDEKAPWVMDALKRDFGFTTVQAAAVLGNLGHECYGFRALQEMNPVAGRGGYGWARWRGPRRNDFEDWCHRMGFDFDSDEANYGFLRRELSSTYRYAVRALLRETQLTRAVKVFERKYLVADIPHYPSRERYAEVALESFRSRVGLTSPAATRREAGRGEAAWLEDGLEALQGLGIPELAQDPGRPRSDRGSRTPNGSGDGRPSVRVGGAARSAPPMFDEPGSWDAHVPRGWVAMLNKRL